MTLPLREIVERINRRRRVRRGSLRWSIKTSAPSGPSGDHWGDVAFAEDLAVALRRLGQSVRVDRLGETKEPENRLPDDVTVWLRGLAEPSLTPNAVNILWVISHPDLVSNSELSAGWHYVYAASAKWAGERSEQIGFEVKPLLQAVSRDRFSVSGPANLHEVLFVGTTRGVIRPVVLDSIRVGAKVQIYGPGWLDYVDSGFIQADILPFGSVPAAYRGSRRVLNDHWDDMREQGFVSNRLFDAVASGALVISDQVEGMDKIFGPMVQSYETDAELIDLLENDELWPSKEDRVSIARDVLESHSFDRRAQQLLEDALRAHGRVDPA